MMQYTIKGWGILSSGIKKHLKECGFEIIRANQTIRNNSADVEMELHNRALDYATHQYQSNLVIKYPVYDPNHAEALAAAVTGYRYFINAMSPPANERKL